MDDDRKFGPLRDADGDWVLDHDPLAQVLRAHYLTDDYLCGCGLRVDFYGDPPEALYERQRQDNWAAHVAASVREAVIGPLLDRFEDGVRVSRNEELWDLWRALVELQCPGAAPVAFA